MTVMTSLYCITMDPATNAPGHRNNVVDRINTMDSYYYVSPKKFNNAIVSLRDKINGVIYLLVFLALPHFGPTCDHLFYNGVSVHLSISQFFIKLPSISQNYNFVYFELLNKKTGTQNH